MELEERLVAWVLWCFGFYAGVNTAVELNSWVVILRGAGQLNWVRAWYLSTIHFIDSTSSFCPFRELNESLVTLRIGNLAAALSMDWSIQQNQWIPSVTQAYLITPQHVDS